MVKLRPIQSRVFNNEVVKLEALANKASIAGDFTETDVSTLSDSISFLTAKALIELSEKGRTNVLNEYRLRGLVAALEILEPSLTQRTNIESDKVTISNNDIDMIELRSSAKDILSLILGITETFSKGYTTDSLADLYEEVIKQFEWAEEVVFSISLPLTIRAFLDIKDFKNAKKGYILTPSKIIIDYLENKITYQNAIQELNYLVEVAKANDVEEEYLESINLLIENFKKDKAVHEHNLSFLDKKRIGMCVAIMGNKDFLDSNEYQASKIFS